jgi:hypothetical protein
MTVAAASQMAFIGWGIGVRGMDFAGFSGHATRAAALYPAALLLLCERGGARLRRAVLVLGVVLAAAVALARVEVGAHSVSEALLGWMLGTCAALLFAARSASLRGRARKPSLAGLLLPLLLLPYAQPLNAQQWITGLALQLSGNDRPWLRGTWEPAPQAYMPPCPREKVHLGYLCT